jgi:hypothetical protein
LSITQVAILTSAALLILVSAGLLLRHFKRVSLQWWLIRSFVAIAPVAVGFGLVYSVHAWNRNGLLLLSFVALVATLLNWRVAKGIADHYADEFMSE